MARNNDILNSSYINNLKASDFKERFPWIGGDLQTLRDTFRKESFPNSNSTKIKIPISKFPNKKDKDGNILAIYDPQKNIQKIKGLVIIIHGLGGSSERSGLRRMANNIKSAGFSTLLINLRGAGEGRYFAGGTYCAKCTTDLIPVIIEAQKLCKEIENKNNAKKKVPLFGVGISLGGTILLNACLEKTGILDGLACTSSPLNLSECSQSIERVRNKIYQKWLLNRLIKQTIADPYNMESNDFESINLNIKNGNVTSIRKFDEGITAPRWGYKDVDDYYKDASPIYSLLNNNRSIPPTLFLQSLDDPWVPSIAAEELKKANKYKDSEIIITNKGGHNGFHSQEGCWGDNLVKDWLINLSDIQ